MKNKKKLNGKALVALALSIEFGLVVGIGFSFPFINNKTASISNLITNKDLGTIDYRKIDDIKNSDDVTNWIKEHLKVNHGIDAKYVDQLNFGTPTDGKITITVNKNEPIIVKGIKYTGSTQLSFKTTKPKYSSGDLSELIINTDLGTASYYSIENTIQNNGWDEEKALIDWAKKHLGVNHGIDASEVEKLNFEIINSDSNKKIITIKISVDSANPIIQNDVIYSTGVVNITFNIANPKYNNQNLEDLITNNNLGIISYNEIDLDNQDEIIDWVKSNLKFTIGDSTEIINNLDFSIEDIDHEIGLGHIKISTKSPIIIESGNIKYKYTGEKEMCFSVYRKEDISKLFNGSQTIEAIAQKQYIDDEKQTWTPGICLDEKVGIKYELANKYGVDIEQIRDLSIENDEDNSKIKISGVVVDDKNNIEYSGNVELSYQMEGNAIYDENDVVSALMDSDELNSKGYKQINSIGFYVDDAGNIKASKVSKTIDTVDLKYKLDSRITSLNALFYGNSNLTDFVINDNFDTSNVTDMGSMFYGCNSLETLDVSKFKTSKVVHFESMFSSCAKLTSISLEGFDTSSATTMGGMFNGCTKLKSIEFSDNWNTSLVIDMSKMFAGCSSLAELDLSNFDTSNVTNMSAMFSNCYSTSLNVSKFDTSKVTDMNMMFCSTKVETLDLSNFDTSNVTNMSYMFSSAGSLENIDFSDKFDTSKVTNMSGMFTATKIETLDLSNFDTSNVTNMSCMFSSSGNTKTINLSGKFSTSNVTNMSSMFSGDGNLTSIILGDWDTSKVTNTSSMFGNCSSLKEIKGIENWNVSQLMDASSMFWKCSSLIEVNISEWSSSIKKLKNVNNMLDEISLSWTQDLSTWNDAIKENEYSISHDNFINNMDSRNGKVILPTWND